MPNNGLARLPSDKGGHHQDLDVELPTWFDSPEYHTYRDEIEALLIASEDRGICTADIHRALGYERQRWTMDALYSLYPEVKSIQPTRYVSRTYYAKGLEWNNQHIFSANGREVLPTSHLESIQ